MTTARIAKLTVPAAHKARIVNVKAAGGTTTPKARIANVSIHAAANVTLQPFADQSVTPLDTVTLTSQKGSLSPVPSAYTWRQISGPAVTWVETNGVINFVAPPVIGGGTIVFGCVASLSGVVSPEVTANIAVLPHLYWVAGSSGWVPLTRTMLAV